MRQFDVVKVDGTWVGYVLANTLKDAILQAKTCGWSGFYIREAK